MGTEACLCLRQPGIYGTISNTEQCDDFCHTSQQICQDYATYNLYSLWGMIASHVSSISGSVMCDPVLKV